MFKLYPHIGEIFILARSADADADAGDDDADADADVTFINLI